jgi:hypothetical protein
VPDDDRAQDELIGRLAEQAGEMVWAKGVAIATHWWLLESVANPARRCMYWGTVESFETTEPGTKLDGEWWQLERIQ